MKNNNDSNSSVKSETPKFETLDEHEAYLKGLSDAKPKTYEEWKEQGKQLFTDRLQPKAKPTVEGEAWRVEPKFYKFGKYREVITNGKLTLCGNISFSKLRTICALLNRAPLGEETKESQNQLWMEIRGSIWQIESMRPEDRVNKWEDLKSKFILSRRSPDKSVNT